MSSFGHAERVRREHVEFRRIIRAYDVGGVAELLLCGGLLLRFFFVQGQTSSFMWCKYGKEWIDSIRFSLFVLLRWLGESFL